MGYEIEIKQGTLTDLFEFLEKIPEFKDIDKLDYYRRNFANFSYNSNKVGGISYSISYTPSWAAGGLIRLFGIFPEYRGFELGRESLQALEDYLIEKNDIVFMQAIPPDTPRAFDFYLANGFEPSDDMLFKWVSPQKFARMKTR